MRKTLTVAVAALAIGLAGCTTSQDNTNTDNYPREAKDNFVDDCTSTAVKDEAGANEQQVRDSCLCVVTRLEDGGLPYDRKNANEPSFKDADQAIKDGNDVPANVKPVFDKARADCRR